MRLQLLAGILLLAALAQAQKAVAPSPNLELRLQPVELQNGVPKAFTFELVNISDHDVHLPKPLVDCSSGLNGYIWLQLDFTPLKFSHKGSGFGCAADVDAVGIPIKNRIQNWILLHPCEISKQTVGMQGLHYDDKGPGRYEFWAEYRPPAINPDDQKALSEAGMDFPRAALRTMHLVYRKQR